jgi:hypothetical protein
MVDREPLIASRCATKFGNTRSSAVAANIQDADNGSNSGQAKPLVRKQASRLGRMYLIVFVISCAIFETNHEKNHGLPG